MLKTRGLLGIVFLLATAAMAAGYYTQHVVGLEPCPLCIVQRMAYIGAGLMAVLGWLANRYGWMRRSFATLAALLSAAGAGVAGWQCWLIAHPPAWPSCGRPFAWMLENNSLIALLPKLFKGEGDCLTVSWTLLSFSIPQWSLAIFVVMTVMALLAASSRR
ncbi:disulfide bond formation protein B [soil metagenome]